MIGVPTFYCHWSWREKRSFKVIFWGFVSRSSREKHCKESIPLKTSVTSSKYLLAIKVNYKVNMGVIISKIYLLIVKTNRDKTRSSGNHKICVEVFNKRLRTAPCLPTLQHWAKVQWIFWPARRVDFFSIILWIAKAWIKFQSLNLQNFDIKLSKSHQQWFLQNTTEIFHKTIFWNLHWKLFYFCWTESN